MLSSNKRLSRTVDLFKCAGRRADETSQQPAAFITTNADCFFSFLFFSVCLSVSGVDVRRLPPTLVHAGSPADKADLEIGDEILEVNGKSLEGATHTEVISHIHQVLNSLNCLATIYLLSNAIYLQREPKTSSRCSSPFVLTNITHRVNSTRLVRVALAAINCTVLSSVQQP